ncbi:MAG: IS110 family transposase [Planctomycetota bacterium]|jgi:transposase
MELFIGFDWADEDHDVYLTNEIGEELDSFSIENSLLGLDKFLKKVKKHGVSNDCVHAKTKSCVAFCIAIETPHGLMVNALVGQGYKVYPINPKAVKNERKTYRASDARDDDFDAYVLAHMLRMRVNNYTPLSSQTQLTEEIRILSEDRHKLVEQKTRLLNQLSATLKAYYPSVISLFSSLDTQISLSFLSTFPTPQDARELSIDELSQFLSANGYPYPKRVDSLYEKLQQEQLEASTVIVRTNTRQMIVILNQLKVVIPAIKKYDEALEQLLEQHQDTPIFLSLPSVSNTLAASLIGQLSEQQQFFNQANVRKCKVVQHL